MDNVGKPPASLLSSPAMAHARPQRLAQYELLREVGSGAMGVVYEARDVDLQRRVAIKFLHRATLATPADPGREQRFMREARSAAQLTHANVAIVYQVGRHEGASFIAMEWLDGEDLSRWIKRHGAMPWRDALQAVADAAAGLGAAHAAGLVHRDIKPSNLMRLPNGQVKLVDFGLARLQHGDSELTRSGALLGTPAYLSPEQCLGEAATPASDLYSLGCTLYHLLTGEAPFDAPQPFEILRKHVHDPAPDPRLGRPELPPVLTQIVQRAIAKQAHERYASAAELLAELQAAREGKAPGTAPHLSATLDELAAERPGPNNLPADANPFIGRRALTVQARQHLLQTRLLTLVGPGGTGKTRLALQLARWAAAHFPDGVWWIELAPLAAGQPVDAALAAALALREGEGQDLRAALLAHLKPRAALLVLDNCEHVLEPAAALVAELLAAAPRLQVLASSRQPLAVPGEACFAVPPMQLCRSGAALPELAESEAVQLFVTRARAVRSSFVLDADNAAVVAEICGRLDGIPLAIELAAARSKVLAPAQIATRLADAFELLTGGQRTQLPRQQTLRALIDWSYVLLRPAQRLLFERLAVFRGDFDLEAAQAVLADQALPGSAVLDGLAELVDQSLLVAGEHDGGMRYHLLQTIRQYAAERLSASGAATPLERRYAEHYARALTQQAATIGGQGDTAAMAAIGAMQDNARAAFELALQHCWHDLSVPLLSALSWYGWFRGILAEGAAQAERLLALEPPASPALAQLLERAAAQALGLGREAQAQAWLEQGLAIAETLHDEDQRSRLLRGLGNLAVWREDWDLAEFRYEQAVQAARAGGTRDAEALALANLGSVLGEKARNEEAREYLLQALALFRAEGNLRWVAGTLSNLGATEFDLGHFAAARRCLEDCLALRRTLGDSHPGMPFAIRMLAECLMLDGELPAAQALLDEGLEKLRQRDDRLGELEILECLTRLAMQRRQPERAKAWVGQHLALAKAIGEQRRLATTLELVAELRMQDDPAFVARLLGTAAALRVRWVAPLSPRLQKEVDSLAGAVAALLGAARFAQLYAGGQGDELQAVLRSL